MGTQFILVRHGQTAWNLVERFRGRADIPLNDSGLEQARRVARRLAGVPYAAVYASPLQRAVETARPIAEAKDLPVQPHPGLLDIDFGALQGLTVPEALEQYPEECRGWLTRPGEVHFPGGESLDQVRARATGMLQGLAAAHAGAIVVLVGHKIINKVILCIVLGLTDDDLWRVEQDNAAINRFEFRDGAWMVQLLNDTCHLD